MAVVQQRVALAVGALLVPVCATGTVLATGAEYTPARSLWLLGWFAASALLVFGTRCLSVRVALALGGVLLLGTAVGALLVGPRSSTDLYRYVWDGIVQTHGHDPYAHARADHALDSLKPGWLFPPGGTPINRPAVRTIYPPGAQLWFSLLALLTLPGVETATVRVGALLAAAASAVLMVRLLRASGRDPRWVLLWLASPMAAWEAAGNGHVDALAVLVVLLGLDAVRRGRAKRAGVWAALAFTVKFFPAGALVAGVRKKPLAFVGTAVAVVAGLYLPHVLAVGSRAVGFLPDYVDQEGFDGSQRYPALRLLHLPPHVCEVLGPLILVAVVAAAIRWARPAEPWVAGLWVTGTGTVLVGSIYPWYGMVLLALVVVSRRWEWMAVVVAPYVWNVGHDTTTLRLAWGAAALVALVGTAVRLRPGAVHGRVGAREHVAR